MTDDLVVTAEEVRAVARFPRRGQVLAGSLVALALAALALVSRGDAPVAPPEPTPFDPAMCAPVRPPEPCLARLPPELRTMPTTDQYVRWRTVDVVQRMRPVDASELALGRAVALQLLGPDAAWNSLRAEARSRIRRTLTEIDPWYRARTSGGGDDPGVLIAIGVERDWGAEPPALPPLLTVEAIEAVQQTPEQRVVAHLAGTQEALVRAEVGGILEDVVGSLRDERRALFQRVWREVATEEARQAASRADAHRFAVAQRRFLAMFAALAGGIGALLGATWASRGPRVIVAGLHHLRIGRGEIPWADVTGADWRGRPMWIAAGSRTWNLGPRVLTAEAQDALAQATERMRARPLAPLDPDALRRLQTLRSDGPGE